MGSQKVKHKENVKKKWQHEVLISIYTSQRIIFSSMNGSTNEPAVNQFDQPIVNQRADNSEPQKVAFPSNYQLITYLNTI